MIANRRPAATPLDPRDDRTLGKPGLAFRLAGALVVLVALADRLPRLADHSVWWDEGFSIYLARMPLLQAAYRTAFDVHPPFYYWLLHFWIRLVGESEFAVRYSTVLFAVLTVALVAALGRRLLGPREGVLAALILALARIDVEWSQEMRMYTVATALVIGLLYVVVMLARAPTRPRWLGLVGLATLTLYTLYIAGLTLFAMSLGSVLEGFASRASWSARRAWVVGWVAATLAVVALYLPWLIVLSRTPRPAPQVLWTLDFRTYVQAYLTVMPLGVSTYLDRYVLPTALFTILVLLGCADLARHPKTRPLAVAGLCGLTIMPAIVYVMSLPNPIFFKPNLYVRYLLILLPIYDLFLARALVFLWERGRLFGAVGAAFVIAASGWALWTYYPTKVKVDDYPSLTRFIFAHAQPGDEVVLYPDRDWPIFGYYNHDGMAEYGVGTAEKLTAEAASKLGASLLAAHPSLWVLSIDNGHDSDPNGFLAAWLGTHTRTVGELTVDNKRVTLVTRDPARTLVGWTLPPERALSARPAPGLSLVGMDLPVDEIAAGGTLNLALYWQATSATGPNDRVVVWLADSSGQIVRARSWPLALAAGERWRADYALPIPKELPAGTYALRAGIRASQMDPPGKAVDLAAIQVDSDAPARQPVALATPLARFGSAIAMDRIQVAVNGQAVPSGAPVLLHPNDHLTITADWQALAATDHRYTVFAHLIGPTNPATKNPVWAQRDSYPNNGASPTDDWLPGQTVADVSTLVVPANAPPGDYSVEMGLYELPSGQRAIVKTASQTSDHLIVARGNLTR